MTTCRCSPSQGLERPKPEEGLKRKKDFVREKMQGLLDRDSAREIISQIERNHSGRQSAEMVAELVATARQTSP